MRSSDPAAAFALPPDLLPFARHGGDVAGAAALFPAAPRPWLDLSTGINPFAFPVPPLAPSVWARLPDEAALLALEATAARAYGVADGDTIVAAPGTQALIQRLPGLAAARRVAILGATYAEHAAVWRGAGAAVDTVPSVDALAEADVAVVVNPNNPDGRLVPVAALRRLAGRLASRGGMLVVDEAFVDLLDPGLSLVPGGVPEAALVLRSFGKTYGLAGVRLGFAIGAPPATQRLRALLGPWAVPGPAIAVGAAALGDAGWLVSMRGRLAAAVAALDTVLDRGGFTVLGGTPLFRLTRHEDAAGRFRQLAAAGILVRPFAGKDTLRFGLPGGEADLRRLAAALGGGDA